VRTLKFTLQYDGTGLVGWQRQASGTSVQGLLEDALTTIEGTPVTVYGAGRTDAGVHALGQVAHARLGIEHDTETMLRAANANLPEAVRVIDVSVVADDFHARFSARSKTYEYRIWNAQVVPPFRRLYVWHVPQPLDVAVLDMTAVAANMNGYSICSFLLADDRGGNNARLDGLSRLADRGYVVNVYV